MHLATDMARGAPLISEKEGGRQGGRLLSARLLASSVHHGLLCGKSIEPSCLYSPSLQTRYLPPSYRLRFPKNKT